MRKTFATNPNGYRVIVRDGNTTVSEQAVSSRKSRAMREYRKAQAFYGATNVRLVPPTGKVV